MARSLNDSPYLYGIHEPGGEQYMADAGMRGWILFTEAIGADPNDTGGKNFGAWADQGYGILVRLNHAYSPDGTIPPASRYDDFARRCANYVRNSSGAHIWIIGNEMNYSIERPGVRVEGGRLINPGETILPATYANCYRQCRTAIRGLAGHESDQVIVGAPAPWNSETKYDGNLNGDWCKYLTDILTILSPSQCDGISIHAYTHGPNPQMIYNDYGMDAPFQNRQYNFRVYRDFMQAIPASMRALPVYLTEVDQNDPWVDNNNGWIQRAYGEIDAWNKIAGNQKIRVMILYRWPRIDQWYIEGKAGVIEDFKQALTYKYNWEKYLPSQPDKPSQPDQPTQPVVPDTSPIAFPQTGKTARGAFAAFYRQYGLDITGYPISDEYTPSDSGLKTQDWQRLTLEEYPAGSGKLRLCLVGAEAADLRQKVTTLQQQTTQLQQQIAQLRQQGGGPIEPTLSDITNTLPRNPAGFFKRPLSAIQYIVINHTAARPSIGANLVAQAHLKFWPGIVGQYYITEDGQIQQTNPIDEVVAQNQSWIYNGISVYVAGNFSEMIPTEGQLTALAQLCTWLMAKYGLTSEAIKGAQELINTQSPGTQWRQGQNWKALLLDRVATTAVQLGPTTPTNDAETVNLRGQVTALLGQIATLQSQLQALNGQLFDLQDRNAALQVQLETLKTNAPTTRIAKTTLTDITQQLPRTASSLKSRSNDQIKYLVFNHTAVDASVGADKLAAAHQKRWGAILYHFFITGDGTIQQTNPLDQTIDLTQPWLAQGINIAVAGDFTAESPAAAQINAAAALSAWLLQEYGLPVDAVKGVSEFISSQSPGAQWLQGKNWKGALLARIAEVQKTAAPDPNTPNNAVLQALQTQLRQTQQALSQTQAAINTLTAERDQWKAKAAQAADTSQLQQQINQLTQQLQATSNEKTALTQQVQGLTNDKATLNQQVQSLNTARTTLTQQVQSLTNDKTALSQQVTTLRGQVDPLQQALNQAQVTISTLTVERDQWKAQASQGGNNSLLQQQFQTLTQQVQGLTNDKTSLTQQVTILNQTIADLRVKLANAQNNSNPNTPVSDGVPLPTMKDITDQLPTHKTNRYVTRPLSAISHLTFHHSAAPGNVPIETIARYHVNSNDWPGIGYHFCIEPDGTIYQVNRLETMAYHAGAVNGYTVGICIEGNFTGGAIPTPLQIQSAAHLAAWLANKFKIPVGNIMGHKEFADKDPKNNTQCPGDDWLAGQQWKQMLHDRVRAVLAGQLATPTKSIGHYLLFWQRADTWAKEDFSAATNYIARFRPTIGFSAEDARNAQYVSIIGGVAGVPFETEQALRDTECKVERLAGRDFADTKRMLDDLAQRGQRFQTLSA